MDHSQEYFDRISKERAEALMASFRETGRHFYDVIVPRIYNEFMSAHMAKIEQEKKNGRA